MTLMYAAVVVALLAWLVQFVAWRREAVARQQLELQVEKLEAVAAIRRHPALRGRPLPYWAEDLRSVNE